MGFIGRISDGVSEEEWRVWADSKEAVSAGAFRNGIASFRIDVYELDLLWEVPMDLVELASRAVPDVNKARFGTRVDSVHAGYNLPQPYHGEGVLIGVLDWGFDYTHPMFYDTTLTTSRIRRFGINTDKQALLLEISITGQLQKVLRTFSQCRATLRMFTDIQLTEPTLLELQEEAEQA